jgi:predicted signal transduction protein with EAL and GGDEF domain
VVAERLRAAVASNALAASSRLIPATVSIGIAESAASMNSISELMTAADNALYEAKRNGRNRVICSISSEAGPKMVGEEATVPSHPAAIPSACVAK